MATITTADFRAAKRAAKASIAKFGDDSSRVHRETMEFLAKRCPDSASNLELISDMSWQVYLSARP